jgi:Protein of unknown function (DUF2905)
MHTIKRALSNRMTRSAQIARDGRWPASRPLDSRLRCSASDRCPVTMFSSRRLFSEELPIADIPGIMIRLGARHRISKNADIAMATFLKIFIVVLVVVLLAHALIGWLRPEVTPGLSFLPGDIKYESSGGNVRVYFPIVTSIVLSVVLTLILHLFGRFFGR